MSDEELPDPEKENTKLERWAARNLTPYRVFWIKQLLTFSLIIAFLWAGSEVMSMKQEAARLTQQLNESGCSVIYQEMGGVKQQVTPIN